MKSIQVVPHIHNESSGPSYSVAFLGTALSKQGVETTIACLKPGKKVENVKLKTFQNQSLIKKMGRSAYLHKFLKARAKSGSIIHNHSLWMFPNFYPGWAKKTISPEAGVNYFLEIINSTLGKRSSLKAPWRS